MAGILDEVILLFKPQVDGSGFDKLNNNIKRTHENIFSMKNLLRGFIGFDVYSGLKSFGQNLVQSTRDLGAMTSRFYAITKSEALANEELQWTFDLAKRTAMGLKATADSYSIFYAATQRGLGTEGARQVFQDWTEVSRVLHLSEYQFERVTYALREMASKGAIYSQDLRMQIGTHVPNAMGLAEKAVNELGVTGNNWFEDFRKQAKGNQQLINQFIVLFSKYAKEAYASPEALAKALEQPDAQIQKLYNTWQEFLYSLAGGQFQKDLVKFLKLANFLLENITKHAGAIYKIFKQIIKLFISFNILKGVMFLIPKIQSLRLQIALLGMEVRGAGVTSTLTLTKIRTGIKLLKLDVIALKAVATCGLSLLIDLLIELIFHWEDVTKRISNWKWVQSLLHWFQRLKIAWLDLMDTMANTWLGKKLGWVSPYAESKSKDVKPTFTELPSSYNMPLTGGLYNKYPSTDLLRAGYSGNSYNVSPNITVQNKVDINGSNLSQDEVQSLIKASNTDLTNKLVNSQKRSIIGTKTNLFGSTLMGSYNI